MYCCVPRVAAYGTVGGQGIRQDVLVDPEHPPLDRSSSHHVDPQLLHRWCSATIGASRVGRCLVDGRLRPSASRRATRFAAQPSRHPDARRRHYRLYRVRHSGRRHVDCLRVRLLRREQRPHTGHSRDHRLPAARQFGVQFPALLRIQQRLSASLSHAGRAPVLQLLLLLSPLASLPAAPERTYQLHSYHQCDATDGERFADAFAAK